MRLFIIAACAIATTATLAAAQSSQPASTPPQTQQPLSLTGCVPVETGNANRFRVVPQPRSHGLFRTAKTALLQVGDGVRVAGGLVPSPNIAAQAGSIDPTIPAMAMAFRDQYWPTVPRAPVVTLSTGAAPVRVDCGAR
jgi:hypothetical protein